MSDSEEADAEASGSEDDLVFEEGDRLFYVKMPVEAEFIQATQTTSVRGHTLSRAYTMDPSGYGSTGMSVDVHSNIT